jgi:arylsulfatase A-like enzyme
LFFARLTQPLTPDIDFLNRLKTETRIWDDEPLDTFTFHTALEFLKERKPRVLFPSLGETDEWAHAGKYATYLQSAHSVDRDLRELWEMVQSLREYRDSTTLIFTCDHGQGNGRGNGRTTDRRCRTPNTSGWPFSVLVYRLWASAGTPVGAAEPDCRYAGGVVG